MNGELNLHAYLDGELGPAEARAVEDAIAADPVLAARVAAFRADKAMLRDLYAPAIESPVPQEWIATARGARPTSPVSWRMVSAIAATIMIAALGVVTYERLEAPHTGEIVAAALAARAGDAGRPVEGDADAAISQAVALKVKAPDLGRMGYRLAGVRLYGRAAELDYRDHAGRLFTLYLRHSDGAARFDQFARGNLRVCVWQDDELGMVMAGDVSTAAMQRLASLAYTGLTL